MLDIKLILKNVNNGVNISYATKLECDEDIDYILSIVKEDLKKMLSEKSR